jgi:2'-5' RNA ligase
LRVFLALFLPAEVKRAVAAAVEGLRSPGDGVSWVREENLHYTLRFLGELGEDGARRAGEAMAEAAARHARFELEVAGFGCFPPKGAPRVLWVGARRGAEALEALARDLEGSLRARGFDRADHPFRAHLTVGRVRDWRPGRPASKDWRAALEGVPLEAPAFTAERVVLVHSTLSPKGSIYRAIREAELGRR